ncbi:polysaccharide deacetylase family protein [Maritalea myrionectae]|uniref:polysaccharide deacetylase family protein n=1 Tax=Maritalea myrionectae TaxID=454601 RepID=UPI000405F9AF|nr:polysaccharide deacetylase family protein [Maritalea myrionectae]
MAGLKYKVLKAGFEVLAATRLTGLIRRFSASKGVIFTLHRVLPDGPQAFSPNAILQITPEFLEQAIMACRTHDIDIVDLTEARKRIEASDKTKKFAVFTFDDAYRDNLQFALPILKKHNCPFTLFVPTAFPDGEGDIWWQALEDIIAQNPSVEISLGEQQMQFATQTTEEKSTAFDEIYWHMRKVPEPDRVALMHKLANQYGYDLRKQCEELIMSWDELKTFAAEPLCTIGAHTVHHFELKKLPKKEARAEILRSFDVLEEKLGKRPTHFSYPLGGPLSAGMREFDLAAELGVETAVTTRPGGLYHDHAQHLTALPRISLNGYFQEQRFLDVFLTGAIFTAQAGMKRVNIS